MTATVKIIGDYYGFGHAWSLAIKNGAAEKIMFLGQDAKVCKRLLQMEPSYVVELIGTKVINEGTTGNKKLANLILRILKNNHNISKKDIWNMNNWELAVE